MLVQNNTTQGIKHKMRLVANTKVYSILTNFLTNILHRNIIILNTPAKYITRSRVNKYEIYHSNRTTTSPPPNPHNVQNGGPSLTYPPDNIIHFAYDTSKDSVMENEIPEENEPEKKKIQVTIQIITTNFDDSNANQKMIT